MESSFRAFVVNKTGDAFTASVQAMQMADLPPGDVVIRVAYSDVNYKDGLACIPNGQIVRTYPFVPGIDLAGTVESSDDARFAPGQEVIVTSYGLGVTHFGGYSELARVPGDWVVPLPEGMTLRDAMALGTAGFTAALALHRLEALGLMPDRGLVLVTGATGGVGSVAILLLARRGYTVAASTGKMSSYDYLRGLGASEIISREELASPSSRTLEKERWAGAIDAVGGETLAAVLRAVRYGGSVAACGLTGGGALPTTVFPFILRAVNLLGIDSVQCPMPLRQQIWQRLALDLPAADLERIISRTVGLSELPEVTAAILQGSIQGRVLVAPTP